MRPAEAARVRNAVSQSLAKALGQTVTPFVGRSASKALVKLLAGRTRPLVSGARSKMSRSATEQYKTFLAGGKPLAAPKLVRFTEDVWFQSLEKAILPDDTLAVLVTQDHADQIVRSGEHWALDAERGSLIDYSIRDDRIMGWTRVDPIPPTCPFCTVLISIGPVRTDPLKAHFHAGDTCEVRLVAPGQTDYEGASQVADAKAKYEQAVRLNGGKTDLAGLVAALKKMDPTTTPEG